MFYINSDNLESGETLSFPHFIGGPNTGLPNAQATSCLFIKGASATMSVEMQTCAVPTPLNQDVTIFEDEWLTLDTYVQDVPAIEIPPLLGLWVRFKVTNTGGIAPLVISYT